MCSMRYEKRESVWGFTIRPGVTLRQIVLINLWQFFSIFYAFLLEIVCHFIVVTSHLCSIQVDIFVLWQSKIEFKYNEILYRQ